MDNPMDIDTQTAVVQTATPEQQPPCKKSKTSAKMQQSSLRSFFKKPASGAQAATEVIDLASQPQAASPQSATGVPSQGSDVETVPSSTPSPLSVPGSKTAAAFGDVGQGTSVPANQQDLSRPLIPKKASKNAVTALNAALKPAQPAALPAGTAGQHEEAARKCTLGSGKKPWHKREYRLAQYPNFLLELNRKENKELLGFVHWCEEQAALLCSTCCQYYGETSKARSVWTCPEGNCSIKIKTCKEHLTGDFHVTAVRGLIVRAKADGAWDKARLAAHPMLASLFRIAYKVAYKMQSIASYEEDVATHAANGATGIEVGGPYRSRLEGLQLMTIISEVLRDQLIAALKESAFLTVAVDESTDKSIKKHLAIFISYLTPSYDVEICYLKLAGLVGGADAKRLFDALEAALKENKVEEDKIVGFTSDGASVMTGGKTGLAVRIKDICPHTLAFVCVAHKLQLGCADLFKDVVELQEYDQMLSAISTYFSNSPGRRENLEEVQKVLEDDVLHILRHHKIRWLSRADCVERIRVCYPALLLYFAKEAQTNNAAVDIHSWLRHMDTLLLTYALADILSIIAALSRMFQSNDVSYCEVDTLVDRHIKDLTTKYTYHTVGETSHVEPTLSLSLRQLISNLRENGGKWKGAQLSLRKGGAGPDGHGVGSSDGPARAEGEAAQQEAWRALSASVFKGKRFVHGITTALCENLRERFPKADLGVASAFKLFSPAFLAEQGDAAFGEEEIVRLADWFGKDRGGKTALLDGEKLCEEWEKLRGYFVEEAAKAKAKAAKAKAAAAASAAAIIAARPSAVSGAAAAAGPSPVSGAAAPTEQPDVILGTRAFWKPYICRLVSIAPNLARMIQIVLVVLPASAEVERGFSAMNDIKTTDRASLTLGNLDVLMRIRLNGPEIKVRGTKEDPPFKAFDEEILPYAIPKRLAMGMMPNRSNIGDRPRK